MVIGFSLGSVVAYETIKNFPDAGGKPVLITLGSPLGSPVLNKLVKRFLKAHDHARPAVVQWFNLFSPDDFVSGRINGLGCRSRDQFKVKSQHKMTTYLRHAKRLLPQLF